MQILNKTTLLNSVISLMCLGCGFKPISEPMMFTSTSRQETRTLKSGHTGGTIRILCWNIHKENDQASFQAALSTLLQPDERMRRQHPAYAPPDILLFQEVFMASPEAEAFDQNPDYFGNLITRSYNMDWVFAPNLIKNDTFGGVLTASSFRLVDSRAFISDSCEYLTRTPKTSVVTFYDLGRGAPRLMVVNVHGINIKPGMSEFKRQLHRVAEFVKKHDGPVILAGDFNTWRLRRYELLDTLAEELGFEKVEFSKAKQTKSFMGWGYPLDHIYISSDSLAVVKGSELVLDGLSVSDHTPLWVELKLRHFQPQK